MRFQDETSHPASPRSPSARPVSRPNVANGRPRSSAEADAERSRKKRKRILIGAGVTVGLVAV